MIQFKAPEKRNHKPMIKLFLAGSIDQGKAIEWQKEIVEYLKDTEVAIYNPRRDDWNPNLVQSIDNPGFKEQVTWELESLEASDIILFVFDPKGQAPITLLELGLFVNKGKTVLVVCPEGYWRKGNVDIVCERYKVPMLPSVEKAANIIKRLCLVPYPRTSSEDD